MTSTTAEPANSTFSCEKGLELGKQIGEYTLGHHLKPRSDYKGL
jgi:hypothetical protein